MIYRWIWQHLPGNKWVKSAMSVLLLIGLIAILFIFVFPVVDSLFESDPRIGD